MAITGSTETKIIKEKTSIQWGYSKINPITQLIEYFYQQRKKN